MAKYPFDEKFNTTVQNLPDYDGDGWYYLINLMKSTEDPICEVLTKEGYSPDAVAEYLNALNDQPFSELIELALMDDPETSPALLVLQKSTARDVFDGAVVLCNSTIPKERKVGVLILMRTPGRTFLDEASAVVTKLAATETENSVMEALAYALCHLDVENRSAFLQLVAASPDPSTRSAAAYSLGRLGDEIAIAAKIALSKDSDDDVRNWAIFGLHLGLEDEQCHRQDVRDALYDRISDPYDETRYEAIAGLARCKDSRVLEPLIEALGSQNVRVLAIEASRDMGEPSLYPSLIALREWWHASSRPDLLDEAIAACTPLPEQ